MLATPLLWNVLLLDISMVYSLTSFSISLHFTCVLILFLSPHCNINSRRANLLFGVFSTILPVPMNLPHSRWGMGAASTQEVLPVIGEGFLEESWSMPTEKVAFGPATPDNFPERMGWVGVCI